MEFLFGALVSIMAMMVGKVYLNNKTKISPLSYPRSTQSSKYDLVKPIMQFGLMLEPTLLDTQATRYHDETSVKVLFTEGKAYWITGTAFYEADINEEGLVEEESTRQVDIMGMDKVELDKMSYIVEKLTEGKRNDNWGSGNS